MKNVWYLKDEPVKNYSRESSIFIVIVHRIIRHLCNDSIASPTFETATALWYNSFIGMASRVEVDEYFIVQVIKRMKERMTFADI